MHVVDTHACVLHHPFHGTERTSEQPLVRLLEPRAREGVREVVSQDQVLDLKTCR